MIHFFNPDHETAVLNASKHYHPPTQVAKMQADLAFLPAWYAFDGDFVFMEKPLPDGFLFSLEPLNFQVLPVSPHDFTEKQEAFQHSILDLWGISPQSVHFFEELNKSDNLSLAIPPWKEEYRFLGSRFASQKLLSRLLDRIPEVEPDIFPLFFPDIEKIEQANQQSPEPLLVKSPHSSSGRGLLRLLPGKLTQSERQIIGGMLKKQGEVSIEKLLNKQLDFSMQFENTVAGDTRFLGYSIFQTNLRGAYEKSSLDTQSCLEKQISHRIENDLLVKTRTILSELIHEMYANAYHGIIGVDLLVYKTIDANRLHPCVEINMRKTMGYLAFRLAEKYLHPDSHGDFFIDYNRNPTVTGQKHDQFQKLYPLIFENGRIRSGYLSLCPIKEDTNYRAYVIIKERSKKYLV